MPGVLLDYDVEMMENKEPLDLDDWNARPFAIMDRISVIEREECMDKINDWKEHGKPLREEASTGLGGQKDGL